MLDMIAAALDAAMWFLYDKLVEFLQDHWANSSMDFNSGQTSIYWQYLQPAVDVWLDEAYSDWPYADPDAYAEEVMGAYDYEVGERAFSETITSPLSRMWDIVEKAIELGETSDMLQAAGV